MPAAARSVPTLPNLSFVVADVLSVRAADDGWGAWADLHVRRVANVAGSVPTLNASDVTIRVFVPPPLVASVFQGGSYEGLLTLRGGTPAIYALVPPRR